MFSFRESKVVIPFPRRSLARGYLRKRKGWVKMGRNSSEVKDERSD
jgi:hypothetical protein